MTRTEHPRKCSLTRSLLYKCGENQKEKEILPKSFSEQQQQKAFKCLKCPRSSFYLQSRLKQQQLTEDKYRQTKHKIWKEINIKLILQKKYKVLKCVKNFHNTENCKITRRTWLSQELSITHNEKSTIVVTVKIM